MDRKQGIAVAVVLEAAMCVVAAPAVRFHDEFLRRPEKVHCQVVQRSVYKRLGKAVLSTEAEELLLKVVPSSSRAGLARGQHLAKRTGPGFPMVLGDDLGQPTLITEPEALGLIDSAFKRSAAELGCEIEQGAAWGGYRNPAVSGPFRGPQRLAAVQD